MRITVYGVPAPQGSKSPKGTSKSGKIILVESSKAVKPWRESIVWACRQQMPYTPIEGPVAIDVTFCFQRPKHQPKKLRQTCYCITRPDVDKIERSLLDSLRIAGVYRDDSQVVTVNKAKVYAGSTLSPLDVPGMVVHISEVW